MAQVSFGDRELALVALVSLALAVRYRDAGGEDRGERRDAEHERLAPRAEAQVARPGGERMRAGAEGDERDAGDEQPERRVRG